MDEIDINLCRICLKLNGKILVFESIEENSIADTLQLLTNIHIENYENVPDKICLDCMEKINILLQFKEDIKNSEDKFKKILLLEITKDADACGDESWIKTEESEDSCSEGKHTAGSIDNNMDENYSTEEETNIPIRTSSKRSSSKSHQREKLKANSNTEKDKMCKYCGKGFKSRANLLNHLRIHTGERPYECDICFKRFAQSGNLFNHKRSHATDRPFICEVCSKQFTSSGNLQQHMLTHVTERNYKCNHCTKSFRHKKALKSHLHLHSEVKDRICGYCGKSFYMTNYLTRHIKTVHNLEKKFKCSECGKAFSNSSNLQAHFRIHTGEKPFECKYCDAKFNQSSPLQRHMQQHLKNNDKLKTKILDDEQIS